jgi:hypothetical protein
MQMISPIQTTDTLDLASRPVNQRAPEFYRQGSSFHDLFTAPEDPTPVRPASNSPSPALSNAVPANSATVTFANPLPPTSFEQGAVVTGPDGSSTPLNSMEMASADAAAQIAAKLGGTVTADQFSGGFSTSADIREISFANSNVKINAGLAANLFATYGDAPGSEAWRVINSAFNRDPMATGPVS